MTRGRVHNEAIAIARTAAAARDQVAASMMRGSQEVSIDDSSRAARAELGRAARDPGTQPASALEEQREWLSQAALTLLDIDQRTADAAARAHGRGGTTDLSADLDHAKERLLARYQLVNRQYAVSVGRAENGTVRARVDPFRPIQGTSGVRGPASDNGLGR
jgi:hypothetical protein